MIPIVVVFLCVAIGIRVMLHFLDKSRIESAARRKGWRKVEVTWSPFAPGWLFEKGERHYRVSYLNERGTRARRYCKTGLLTGVFWRDESA